MSASSNESKTGDLDKNRTKLQGHAHTCSKHKKVEEAMGQNEERFAKAFYSTPVAMFISRFTDGCLVDVNESFLKILGYKYEEVIGHTSLELNIYPDPSKRAEIAQIMQKQGVLRNFELTVHTKMGKPVMVLVSVDKICLSEQDYVLGTFIDITARKQAEEALRESEERFRVVAEAAKIMVYATEVSTGKSIVYRGSEELVGFKPDEVDFTVDWVLSRIHPDDVNNVLEHFKEALKEGGCESYTVKYRFLHKNGKYITVQDTAKAIRDSLGKTTHMIGGVYDITERETDKEKLEQYSKHLEELVEERTKQLKNSERMATIGQVAGMVGHDLRNPLQSIIGEVYLAKTELKSIPDSEHKTCLQESIQAIAEQIGYMDKIVSDLQTFVKPVEAHKQTVNLKQLIVGLLAQINIPKNIQTIMQADGALTVDADPQLLKRVLINLVTNAVQAMPQGGELTIKAQTNNQGQIQISVKDTGVGIPDEVKSKLFTPLFTTKAKGQGFGLAVCKRVVEAQNGNISFSSQVGRGSKFIIELPAA